MAKRKKARKRRVRRARAPKRRRSMARRKRRGSRKSKQGIPIVQVATLGYPIMQSYNSYGLTTTFVNSSVRKITGYNPADGSLNLTAGLKMGAVLFAESTIGRKIANRVGANKLVKQMTAGYFQLM